MRYNLLPLIVLALPLLMSAAVKSRQKRSFAFGNDESPKPCRFQSEGDQLRCVVPQGYQVRSGDCPGNNISSLYRDSTTLKECAQLCSSSTQCQAFMFYNNHRCHPKTKTCGVTSKSNPLNVFYDKVPSGYTMRPGSCPGSYVITYFGRATRQRCARNCGPSRMCQAFMHDGLQCFVLHEGCGLTSLSNKLNILYDKVPDGYTLRPGDCSGNDLWAIHGRGSLKLCVNRCNYDPNCIAFMYLTRRECYAKTKTCAQPSTRNPKSVFYDKVPQGYAMRPGDCSGNEIWSIHGFVSLAECARRCNNNPACISFMFYDGRECYPKTKTCATTSKANPKNFFYDKIKII